jgi:hypothetical protein
MLPPESELQFCIMNEGEIVDGANGLAIGATEQEAWERCLNPCEDWSIARAKEYGHVVRRCALMVINP